MGEGLRLTQNITPHPCDGDTSPKGEVSTNPLPRANIVAFIGFPPKSIAARQLILAGSPMKRHWEIPIKTYGNIVVPFLHLY